MSKSWLHKGAEFKADLLAGGLIFSVTLFIFWLSPMRQVTDSRYSMMVSQCLLEHGSFALDHYAIPRLDPVYNGDYVSNGGFYQLELVNNHIYYFFPPGSSVLSLPYVALMNAFGISAVNRDGTYNWIGETRIQASLAALLMAALASIFFHTARLVLPWTWSVLVSFAGALGTQVWSTASRGLWSETWGIFLLGLVIFMLLAQETGKLRANPVILASLLAWSYFVRPTNSIPILAISLYLFAFHRRLFLPYVVTGVLWGAGFVAYSLHNFGQVLPNYYLVSRLRFDNFWTALAGNLVAPSSGVLVYVPALFVIAYLLARYWNDVAFPRLVVLALAVVVGHLLTISGFTIWWGGHGYGPRLTTGLVPWFVLLGVLGLQAMLKRREERALRASPLYRGLLHAAGGLLLLLGIFINSRGAISLETWKWISWMEKTPSCSGLWSWSYPQFLAGLVRPPEPGGFPPVETETRIDFTKQESDKYIWYGWSGIDNPQFRWTDAREATIIFALNEITDIVMRMKLGPFLVPGKLVEQDVQIILNGQSIGDLALREETSGVYSLVLARDILRHKNVLTFKMPNAASPDSLESGGDIRLLGIKMEWVELRPQKGTYP